MFTLIHRCTSLAEMRCCALPCTGLQEVCRHFRMGSLRHSSARFQNAKKEFGPLKRLNMVKWKPAESKCYLSWCPPHPHISSLSAVQEDLSERTKAYLPLHTWSMFLFIRIIRTKGFNSIPHMPLTRLSKVAEKGGSCTVWYKGKQRGQPEADFRRRKNVAMMSMTKITFQGCAPLGWFSWQAHASIWPYCTPLFVSNCDCY